MEDGCSSLAQVLAHPSDPPFKHPMATDVPPPAEAFDGPHSSLVSAHLRRQSEVAAREGKNLVRVEESRQGLI